MSAVDELPARQREAADWLRSVGHASLKIARRRGFERETLMGLVEAGVAERRYSSMDFGRVESYAWTGDDR